MQTQLSITQENELLVDGHLDEILDHMYTDILFFARVIFPKRFFRGFSKQHEQLAEVLDDRSINQILVMAHRGIGKTSLIQLAYAAREILFRTTRFMVTTSCSNTHAVMQSETLKGHLARSDIKALFGPLKPDNRSTPDAKDLWVVVPEDLEEDETFSTVVIPRGAGQQVRGMLYGDDRPDLILTDDLIDPQKYMTEEAQDKLSTWFFGSYINVVDRGKPGWRHIVIGTPTNERDLLWKLKKHSKWTTVEMVLCDSKCNTYWPAFMTTEDVKELKEEFTEGGKLDEFYREYRNLLTAPEGAPFQESMFQYYDHDKVDILDLRLCENVVIGDPAKTTNFNSADSAVVGISIPFNENKIRFADCVNYKMHPEEFFYELCSMAHRIKARIIAIETTSLHEWLEHTFRDYLNDNGWNFELIFLKARDKKENRVRWLIPYYRQHQIEHNKAICGTLEEQLLTFPRSEFWDVMDAFAYIILLLEEGERYFINLGRRTDEEEDTEKLAEEAFGDDPVEEDLVEQYLVSDWRLID